MHLVFYKRDCVLAMELWVDYMRETASLLTHIDISKRVTSENISCIMWQKNYPIKKKLKPARMVFNYIFNF